MFRIIKSNNPLFLLCRLLVCIEGGNETDMFFFFGGNIFKFIKLELFFVQEFLVFSISAVNNLKMDLNLTFQVKLLIHHSKCAINKKKINHFFQFKKICCIFWGISP